MRWLIATLITLPLLAMACDSDDDSDTTIEPDPTLAATLPVDTPEAGSILPDEEELGSVDAVKELIGSVSDLDPGLIRDVDVDDRTLTIMLTEDDSFAESNDVETICSDLNQAIGFTDLEIVIESSSGTQLAECTFTG